VSELKEGELINRPHWERFKLQGENRFLAKVHKNVEHKTAGGIVIANTDITQDIETTGEIIAISPTFDHVKYPDVKEGAQVKVVINSWVTFDCHGEKIAMGDADYIIAVYDQF